MLYDTEPSTVILIGPALNGGELPGKRAQTAEATALDVSVSLREVMERSPSRPRREFKNGKLEG